MKSWASEIGAERRTTAKLSAFPGLLHGQLAYCVLHGWQTPPKHPPSDLDIAIAPKDLEKLEGILAAAPNMNVTQLFQHEAACYYFVLANRQAGDLCFSALDVAVDYRLGGRIYFRARDLLQHSRRVNGLSVAAPHVEFAYLLVKKISKGTLPEHQKTRVQKLYEVLGDDAHIIVRRLLGARWGNQVKAWLALSDWPALESRLSSLKRALRFEAIKRDPSNPFRYWVSEIRRRWRRWRRPTGLFVALLGPDGAGKSTLIEHLETSLCRGGAFRRASVFHLRARLQQRGAPHDRGTDPHRDAPYPAWLSLLKVSYYTLAYLAGYVLVVRPRLVRSTLVLFDRYYDDLLVDPRRYRYGAGMEFVRLARHLVHRPDLCFVLDVAEEQLNNRKQELSREELRRQRKAYLRLAMGSPNAVVLDGALPAAEVARIANDAVVDYLHERYVNRRRLWFGSDDSEKTLQWLTSVLCALPGEAGFDFRRKSGKGQAARGPAIQRFGWMSLGDGRGYLIPLENVRAGLRALDLYNAQSPKASFAKALFATGLRAGMAGRLLPPVHLIARRKPGVGNGTAVHIFEYLRDALRREDLNFGISVGTPGPHRKPVLLVLSGDGRPLAYAKVGLSRMSNALVQREGEMLQFLANQPIRSFSAPAVLHSGWWDGRYVVVQSAPKRETKTTAPSRRYQYLDIPKELAGLHTLWMPLEESALWTDVLLRIGKVASKFYRHTLELGVRKAEARLKGEQLPFHLSHGDFTPWNTRSGGEKIYVFDWEHSREAGLPAQDVFHFYFQEMRCVQRRNIEEIYVAFLRDRRLRTAIETHLAGVGLTGVPVEYLFILYRLDQLANEVDDVRAGVPLFREVAMFGKVLHAL